MTTVALVLAAGVGRRLASASPRPKWLAPVGTSCPGAVQLDALHAEGIHHVVAVTGPGADAIESFVAPWRDRLEVELLPNDRATTWNNWYSALLGLDRCAAVGADEIVLLNSDLFASVAWMAGAVQAVRTGPEPMALAVDPARGRTDEAMKVELDGPGRRVTAIGKTGVDDPGGEYVGLARWSAAGAAELAVHLRSFVGDEARVDHWYEHGIAMHLAAGGTYRAAPVPSTDWVEIDDPADLDEARRLAALG